VVYQFGCPSVSPIINGLSDHAFQYVMVNNIAAAGSLISLKQRTSKIHDETNVQFQLLLKSETWKSVYKDNDANNKFHPFSFAFLNIFEASFPIRYKGIGKIKNVWITQGINVLQM
jgi:hypothetical protein